MQVVLRIVWVTNVNIETSLFLIKAINISDVGNIIMQIVWGIIISVEYGGLRHVLKCELAQSLAAF